MERHLIDLIDRVAIITYYTDTIFSKEVKDEFSLLQQNLVGAHEKKRFKELSDLRGECVVRIQKIEMAYTEGASASDTFLLGGDYERITKEVDRIKNEERDLFSPTLADYMQEQLPY
jgi:hypothetical protein